MSATRDYVPLGRPGETVPVPTTPLSPDAMRWFVYDLARPDPERETAALMALDQDGFKAAVKSIPKVVIDWKFDLRDVVFLINKLLALHGLPELTQDDERGLATTPLRDDVNTTFLTYAHLGAPIDALIRARFDRRLIDFVPGDDTAIYLVTQDAYARLLACPPLSGDEWVLQPAGKSIIDFDGETGNLNLVLTSPD